MKLEDIRFLIYMPVLKQSIKERKRTRKKPFYFGKIISVMRNEFGWHKFSKR